MHDNRNKEVIKRVEKGMMKPTAPVTFLRLLLLPLQRL